MATLNLQVGAGSDDAHEVFGGFSFSSTTTFINRSDSSRGSAYLGGDRFTSVTINQGDTIDSAVLQLSPISGATDDANIFIKANDVDNANNFSTEADVYSRVQTSASGTWIEDGLGTGFSASPDFKAVVQEVVDRAGWASGNAMVIITEGRRVASKNLYTIAYDDVFNGPTNAAKLDIDFTGGGAVPIKSQRLKIGVGR